MRYSKKAMAVFFSVAILTMTNTFPVIAAEKRMCGGYYQL